MIGLNENIRSTDLPYTIRLHGVSEDEFDRLIDEDTKAELIDGVMIVHSPASMRHDDIVGFLVGVMRAFVESKKLGRVFGPDSLVRLTGDRKFAPDVYFVGAGKVTFPLPKVFSGTPDLVIEVLSPSNRSEDLHDKRPAYHEAGVGEIWFIDPDNESVAIDRRKRKRYSTETFSSGRIDSMIIDDFSLDVAWLWQEPLPEILKTLNELDTE